MYTPEDIKEVL